MACPPTTPVQGKMRRQLDTTLPALLQVLTSGSRAGTVCPQVAMMVERRRYLKTRGTAGLMVTSGELRSP